MSFHVAPALWVFLVLVGCAGHASAQPAPAQHISVQHVSAQPAPAQAREGASSAAAATPSASQRTSADESFELNIIERRISESDFAASTAIEAGEETARGLNLRVGVGVGASRLEVLLRNVRGSVRFRGSLEPLLERLRMSGRRETTSPRP